MMKTIAFAKTRYGVLIVVLLVAAGAMSGHPARAQEQAVPRFEPAECWFDSPLPFLPLPEYECGYVTVPEEHGHPDGPTIRLPVAIRRATAEETKPDPLFLAQGGPGGDAFEVFPVLTAQSEVARERDLVIFNQRGTRYAEPSLLCEESFAISGELLMLSGEEADARSLEALAACFQRLAEAGVNLSAYNSLENAADVEAIRQALGYEQFNFYGVSYGTLLGLHLMRNHPENLRSVVIDGVVPPNLNFIPEVTASTDRLFREMFDTCTQSPTCNETYPNLERRFFALVDELDESPQILDVTNPDTSERYQALLDGEALVEILFQAFYLPDAYALFPNLVSRLEQGDYTFLENIIPLFAFDETISEGLYYSVICSEDADFTIEDAVVEGVHPYFAASAAADLQSYLDACALWQVDLLPAEVDDAVRSNIPALVLSGQYDPITPPAFAEVAAEGLEQGYVYVAPTGSHGVAFDDPCLDRIMAEFIDSPQQEPDASCLDEIEASPFIPPNALSFPFLAKVNQLTDALWRELAIASLFLLGVLSAFLVLPLAWLIRTLRKPASPPVVVDGRARRWKRWASLLALLFGLLALVFVSGAAYYTVQAVFSGLANAFVIAGAAAPFFAIPLLLLGLAAALVVLALVAWYRHYWSVAARLYYTFVALCAAGYVLTLATGGMLTVLL